MQKDLLTSFTSRQYMQSEEFEIYYYKDIRLGRVSAHRHDCYELYFFLEGDVTYQVNSHAYPLQPGDYLLIPPGIPHRPVVNSLEKSYRRFVLWINADYYHKLCAYSEDLSYSFDYVDRHDTYRFSADTIASQGLHGRILELIEEEKSGQFASRLNARLMLASLLVYLNRILYGHINLTATNHEKELYLNLCHYINTHLNENLSLDTLASFFFVSKYHISHVFKNNMGISLHQYILKRRLHACKNAILTGAPLNTLYQQYGFNDYTSFYRAFKKEFGTSPTGYRELHKTWLT